MDCRRGMFYDAFVEAPRVGLELARVRTPADAVSFVSRFGLLRATFLPLNDRRPDEAREPFGSFEHHAEDLRGIMRAILDVRKAVKGDSEALKRVRGGDQERSDQELLILEADWAAWGLRNGLVDSYPYVYDRAQMGESQTPGTIRLGVLPSDLLGFCYLTVTYLLADKEPLATCPQCGRLFVVEDGRQKFCAPACANRSRARRYKERQAERRSSQEKGRPDGQARTK